MSASTSTSRYSFGKSNILFWPCQHPHHILHINTHGQAHTIYKSEPGMGSYTVNPRTQEAEAGRCEFEASLLYIASSRIARASQRNPAFLSLRPAWFTRKARATQLRPCLKTKQWAGEMAQWLRAPTALLKVLSSNPSNHMVPRNHL